MTKDVTPSIAPPHALQSVPHQLRRARTRAVALPRAARPDRHWSWALAIVCLPACLMAGAGCGAPSSRGAISTPVAQPAGSSAQTANPAPSEHPGASATGPTAPDTTPVTPPAPPPPRPVASSLTKGDGSELDAVLVQAAAAYDADDFGQAEVRYRQALQMSPRDPAAMVGLARVAIAKTNLATDYNIAPKHAGLERVVNDLKKVLRENRNFGPAYTELGRALLMLGRADEANEALRKAVEFGAEDPEAHSALGVALIATGHVNQAVEELSRAASLDPGSAPRQTNLGTALMMQGRTGDALRAYEAASRLDPNDPRILGDIGTALLADNQVDHAISVLERAVALDPKRATLRSNLGYALQQRHDFEAAIAQYREAIALDDKLVSAWVNLATAFALSGNLPEARKALERAKRIDPTDPRVKANSDELRALEQKKGQSQRGNPVGQATPGNARGGSLDRK